MRILVRCPQCQRRFDAAGRNPGQRFRCPCGQAVTIPTPHGHDAAVVRCSSCAAPRERDAPRCGHCGADFTLHERDLHTVCPNCFARVSDRARYCHHCAELLVGESLPNEQAEQGCPACGLEHSLVGRQYCPHTPAVLECPRCVGAWLTLEALDRLLDREAQRAPTERLTTAAPPGAIDQAPAGGPVYRPCPVCRDFMVRRNFGRGESNVIVDLCRDHGVWFDAHELAALLRWARLGGLAVAQLEVAQLRGLARRVEQRQQEAAEHRSRALEVAVDAPQAWESWAELLAPRGSTEGAMVSAAVSAIVRLFVR